MRGKSTPKQPLSTRIHERALAKWSNDPEWAKQYLVAALGGAGLTVDRLALLPYHWLTMLGAP